MAKSETTTTQEISEDAVGYSRGHIAGKFFDIALSGVLATVPLCAFSAIILWLVFYNIVVLNTGVLHDPNSMAVLDMENFFYANIESTSLVFIASWSSSAAPALIGFVMTLASYPVARRVLQQTQTEPEAQGLTPYQLGLTMSFLGGGGYGAIWRWTKYMLSGKTTRHGQAKPLFYAVCFMLVTTFLSIMVFLTDTWLHVATTSILLTNYNVTSPMDLSPSFGLLDICQVPPKGGCSVSIAVTGAFLTDSTTSLQVLNNVSDMATVNTYKSDATYAYLKPSSFDADIDWRAETFALQTQCRPASIECNLNADVGAATPFNCFDTFHGDVTIDRWDQAFFTDSTLSNNNTTPMLQDSEIPNPFYFGMAALTNPFTSNEQKPDPEIITPMHGGRAFVLLCNTTVYNVVYNNINGTITDFETVLSNSSVATIFQAPMAQSAAGWIPLQQAASLATLNVGDSQDVADAMALSISQIALAIGAQSVEQRPPLLSQRRTSSIVSKVPKKPLYALLTANMLFVLIGIALTILALATSRGHTRDVQARLTVLGLIADRFEGSTARTAATDMDDLFDERQGKKSVRVGVDICEDGGYAYKTWK